MIYYVDRRWSRDQPRQRSGLVHKSREPQVRGTLSVRFSVRVSAVAGPLIVIDRVARRRGTSPASRSTVLLGPPTRAPGVWRPRCSSPSRACVGNAAWVAGGWGSPLVRNVGAPWAPGRRRRTPATFPGEFSMICPMRRIWTCSAANPSSSVCGGNARTSISAPPRNWRTSAAALRAGSRSG